MGEGELLVKGFAYQKALQRIDICLKKGEYGVTLDLNGIGLSRLPREIGQLTALEGLYLASNQLTSLPPEIGQLTSLEILDLHANQLTSLPPEIGQLVVLRHLDLHDNQILSLPREIGQLAALKGLHLQFNQIALLPPEIRQLVALRRLYLPFNRLSSLPPEMGQLAALQYLDLEGNQLTTLPPEIGQLAALRHLHLQGNQLVTMPPEIGQLPLQALDLQRNQLATLPQEIGNLKKLDLLNVEDNALTALPQSLRRISPKAIICLHNNDLLRIPQEVLGPTADELLKGRGPREKLPEGNLGTVLDYYFRIQNPIEAAPLNEFKLILVGRGGVGKTTLVEKLLTDQFLHFAKTPGVKITRWPLPVKGETVQAHVWDFGGQEIMHGTHRFFMTERALYVVLLSGREGTEDYDAEYWLSLIRSFAGKVPVLVLLHKWSEQRFELNRELLLEKYGPDLSFLETDSGEKQGEEKNIPELRELIARKAAELPGLNAQWPKAWRSVKEELPKSGKNWLTYTDFQRFCEAHGVPKAEDQESLAARLHDLGLMLAYRQDKALCGFGVLNSTWVTDGIYKMLNDAALQDRRGRFTLADFQGVLGEEDYPVALHPYLLALMQKFRLCFPLDDEGKEYLIPELLSKREPELDGEFPAAQCLCFTYRYERVLPEGLLPRFIVETHVQREAQHAWRTGVVLEKSGCRALVRGDLLARKVTVRVSGPAGERRKLLGIIREHFERIHASFTALPVSELVPIPGHPEVEVEYEKLVGFEEDQVPQFPERVAGKTLVLQVKELLDGVDVEGVDRHPKAWKTIYKDPPLHVFISYSKQDVRFMEQLRICLVPYERTRELTVWADPLIEPNQEWREEIFGNLDRADIFILLLSPASVANEFVTEKEIPRALAERSKGDPCEILGVVIRPCESGLKRLTLSDRQVVYYKRRAINEAQNRDAAWEHVTQELDKVMARIRERRKGAKDGQTAELR